jgi:hypothetical protein
MRFRQMATYQGVPYEAGVGPTGSDVVLFAACPPPEELGFEPAPGHWRKRVVRADVDAFWESRPIGTFHGEPCLVLDDLGDRLHIAYLGKDGPRARELGFWQVDRGVFELLTPREEVSGLTEEKVEKGLPGTAPDGRAAMAPPMPSYPYAGAQRPPASAAPARPDPLTGNGWNGSAAAHLDPRTSNGRNGNGTHGNGWNGNGSAGLAAGSNGHAANGLGSWDSMTPLATQTRASAPPGNGFPAGTSTLNGAGLDRPPTGRRRAGRRSARKQRVTTRAIFSELADLAAIPRSAYALEQEADGAMCLLRTDDGFEVFSAADGARHEVRTFQDEEAAYFYLFGVLAAEAVRNGTLIPPR